MVGSCVGCFGNVWGCRGRGLGRRVGVRGRGRVSEKDVSCNFQNACFTKRVPAYGRNAEGAGPGQGMRPKSAY